jgi:regulator of RNase E activity RraA
MTSENGAAGTPRADAALLDRFRLLPAANVSDAMERLGVLDSRIRAAWPGAAVVGPAFTVWTRAGDNKVLHEALALAQPGDVIVINGCGDESRALLGELIGARAKVNGIAGFIVDGAVRDVDLLMEMGMPVFARAVTPAGPYKNGPGYLGRTIAVGTVAVAPGDIVVADADGVAIVPLGEADAVATGAELIFSNETERRASILGSVA